MRVSTGVSAVVGCALAAGLLSVCVSACGGGGGEPEDTLAPVTMASPVGGTYQGAQSVTLTCSDGQGSGCAGTYYTLDGSTPTSASAAYTAPIAIAEDTELRFFSVDQAGNEEAVRYESYVIEPVVQDTTPPVTSAAPPGGSYTAAQTVTLTCADTGSGCAATYYTLDGSIPTTASAVYAAPLEIAVTTQLRFFSVDNQGNQESVKSEAYAIDTSGDEDAPVTTAVPPGGTYAAAQSVTLLCDDGAGSGCQATYYTLDGSEPTPDSIEYAAPIQIAADTTLRFFSVDNQGNLEAPKSEVYDLELPQNTPPVAVAGPDQEVAVGALVQLDGTGSFDADGDTLTYLWELFSAPTGSAATLDDPTSPAPSFVADLPGEYRLRLTVNDGQDDSSPDEVLVVAGDLPRATVQPPSGSPVGAVHFVIVSFDQSMNPDSLVLRGDMGRTDPFWSNGAWPNDTLTLSLQGANQGWARTVRIDVLSEAGLPLTLTLVYDVFAVGGPLPYRYVDGQAGDDANDGTSPGLPKRTIQAAIDAAPSPSAVLVAGGDYLVNSDPGVATQVVLRENVKLYGGYAADFLTRDAALHVTRILDQSAAIGEMNAALVAPDTGGIGPDTVVDGFELHAGSGQYCTAVYLNASSPVLRRNTLHGSAGDCDYSYAMYLTASASPQIQECRVQGGTARQETAALMSAGGSLLLERSALDGGSGGHRAWGLVAWNLEGAGIRSNTIAAGSADMATWGAQVTGQVRFSGNTIDGGVGPAATAVEALGGHGTYENNILFTSGGGTRVCFKETLLTGSPDSFRHNDLFECPSALYADYVSGGGDCPFDPALDCLMDSTAVNALNGAGPVSGNVSVDPAFADPAAGDWHLTTATPEEVRDGGLDLSFESFTDKDGSVRLGPWTMGAYEEARTYLYVDGQAGDDAEDGLSRFTPKLTIPAAIAAAPVPAAVLVTGGGYLVNSDPAVATHVVLREGVSLYGGFGGGYRARDTAVWPTSISDQSTATGVNNAAVEAPTAAALTPATLLDGFEVQGGGGTVCAALLLDNSSPTVQHNTLLGGSGCDYAYGVWLSNGSAARLHDNTIHGGQGQETTGVFAEGSLPLLERNAIDGGAGALVSTGIYSTASLGAEIRNNVVRGGQGGQTQGVLADGTVRLANNLLDGGVGTSSSTAVVPLSGAVRIENNIMITSGGTERICIREGSGVGDPDALLANDLADCSTALYADYVGGGLGDCPSNSDASCLTSVAEVEALADIPGGVSGNVSLAPLFADRPNGNFHLSASTPPEVLYGGLDLSADFTDDKDGLLRTAPWSMGAYERD